MGVGGKKYVKKLLSYYDFFNKNNKNLIFLFKISAPG